MTQKTQKNGWEKVTVIALSLLFAAIAVSAAFRCFVYAPEIDDPDLPDENEAETAVSENKRLPNCYTILVSGLDDDNGGSDTNILVRFDAGEGRISLVSLPRDTLLNRKWTSNKLNYAFRKGGTDLLKSEISNLLGIPVDFYITVNLRGFEKLIDQIGGVDFNVPVNMDYDDPYQNLSIHFQKGMQHLDGKDALKVVRWRKNNDGSAYATADIGRIDTQQAFLRVVAQQLKSEVGIDDLPKLADIFFSYVKTDLTTGNLVWLGKEALKIGLEDIEFMTLPGDGSGYYRGESVYVLDPDATLALVNEYLNPYTVPITAEDMDILVP